MAALNQTKTFLFVALLLLGLLSACAAPAPDVAAVSDNLDPVNDLKPVKWWRGGPSFSDDTSIESLVVAGRGSLEYYEKQSPGRTYRFGRDVYTAGELKQFLVDFLTFAGKYPDAGERREYLKKNAKIYRGGGKRKKVLFTGYYEPVLEGSRLPGIQYSVPIFRLPGDLITVDLGEFEPRFKRRSLVGRYQDGTLVPYYTRHEIDRLEALSGRGYEIVWVRDPLEAFFLHIQGSGKILLPDGRVLNVHYAGNNGKPYRPIGRYLAEQEKIALEDISTDTIKKYMMNHPEDSEKIMDYNERYIFFAETKGGPLGSSGILLTPDRSMATDPAFYPPGALAYIETEVPVPMREGTPVTWEQANRFVFNQDAGGGVKGPGRADLFFGTGPLAGERAGEMKQGGKIYFLAPKKAKD